MLLFAVPVVLVRLASLLVRVAAVLLDGVLLALEPVARSLPLLLTGVLLALDDVLSPSFIVLLLSAGVFPTSL